MEDMKINNLASNDSDFDRINFITLYKPSFIPMPCNRAFLFGSSPKSVPCYLNHERMV
jgi:hypothetical protein